MNSTSIFSRLFRQRRCVFIALLLCSALASGDAPPIITLSQLAQQEGWDPNAGSPPNMYKDIPRDFPVPASSHDLSASNGVGAAGVKGVNADQAESFYNQVFKMQNWRIDKHMNLPGCVSFVACRQDGACVNLTAASPDGMCSGANEMKMLFFKDDKKS